MTSWCLPAHFWSTGLLHDNRIIHAGRDLRRSSNPTSCYQLSQLWSVAGGDALCVPPLHPSERWGALMSSLLSTRTPTSSSAELLPRHSDPSRYSCKGFFPSQVQHLAFVFAELHNVPAGPSLQPAWVALDNSPACERINRSPLFGVIGKLEDQVRRCLLQMFSGTAPMTDPGGTGLKSNMTDCISFLQRC